MRRWWKLALGLLIVLVIAVWDVGLPGQRASSAGSAPTRAAAPSSPASASPLTPAAIPGVIQPTGKPEFAATFTGSSLDTSVWDTCYPWMSQSGCNNFGNHEETEWYLPSQVSVSGGLLHLTATREPVLGTDWNLVPEEYGCRSGMVTSDPGFTFEYGYVQIIAYIPAGAGLWPALWLDPASFGWPPEMDLVEYWGDNVYAGSFYHPYPKGSKTSRYLFAPPEQVTGWHTFALSWTRTQMTWLIDGHPTLTVKTNIPHQKMFIIADLATYKPVGTQNRCNAQMLIRSVDVWKP